MAKTIADRIRAARQTSVSIPHKLGAITLSCRRPTDLEMVESGGKMAQRDILIKFVDGWTGVTELHLVPGGTTDPVPFSSEVFAEWVADNTDAWGPICEAVVDGYSRHQASLEETEKN